MGVDPEQEEASHMGQAARAEGEAGLAGSSRLRIIHCPNRSVRLTVFAA